MKILGLLIAFLSIMSVSYAASTSIPEDSKAELSHSTLTIFRHQKLNFDSQPDNQRIMVKIGKSVVLRDATKVFTPSKDLIVYKIGDSLFLAQKKEDGWRFFPAPSDKPRLLKHILSSESEIILREDTEPSPDSLED